MTAKRMISDRMALFLLLLSLGALACDGSAVYTKGHLRFFDDGTVDYLKGELIRSEMTEEAKECLGCRDCCCGWKDPRRQECEDCRRCQSQFVFECHKDRICDQVQESRETINQTCIQTCPSVVVSCGNNVTTVQSHESNQSQSHASDLSQSQNCSQDSRQLVANVSCDHTCNVGGITCMSTCGDQCTDCVGQATCIACFQGCITACAQQFEACVSISCPVTTGEVLATSHPYRYHRKAKAKGEGRS